MERPTRLKIGEEMNRKKQVNNTFEVSQLNFGWNLGGHIRKPRKRDRTAQKRKLYEKHNGDS
jgi:hypothetical protein